MIPRFKKILLIAALLPMPFGIQASFAQDAAYTNDVIPPMGLISTTDEVPREDDMTHPPLNLTPDRSEILNLPAPVGSVILGNPNHINVFADSAKRLIIVPRMQGASHFTVLGQDGEIVMQRNVIVAGERKNYLRIRRGCTSSGCQPTSVYFCPDNCHEIHLSDEPEPVNATSSSDANEEALETALENTMNEAMGNAAGNIGANMSGEGDIE